MRNPTPYDSLTERIIGLAYKVHNELGAGFYERVYESALCIEFDEAGIGYERQKQVDVFYRGHLVGEFIADLIVEGSVLLELKAITDGFGNDHKAQTINYLTSLRLPVGLLINFGRSVELRRFVNKTLYPPH